MNTQSSAQIVLQEGLRGRTAEPQIAVDELSGSIVVNEAWLNLMKRRLARLLDPGADSFD